MSWAERDIQAMRRLTAEDERFLEWIRPFWNALCKHVDLDLEYIGANGGLRMRVTNRDPHMIRVEDFRNEERSAYVFLEVATRTIVVHFSEEVQRNIKTFPARGWEDAPPERAFGASAPDIAEAAIRPLAFPRLMEE